MDKTKLNTLKQRVKEILEVSVSSRNSDASLVANYWFKWDGEKMIHYTPFGKSLDDPNSLAIPVQSYRDFTPPSTIERARRLVQEEACLTNDVNEMGKYLPTNPKVLRARKIKNKIWKDVINNNKIEFIVNFNGQATESK